MFRLSSDHVGQLVVVEEEEEDQLVLGGARESQVGVLQAFAPRKQLSPGSDGGSSVESLLHGPSSHGSSVVDSRSEMTVEGEGGLCASATRDRSLELTVGASTVMDMLRGFQIMAHSALGLRPEASTAMVSASSASTTSEQKFARVFSQLELTGAADVRDTLETTAFRAPLAFAPGETWRGDRSDEELCSSLKDVILGETAPTQVQDSDMNDDGTEFDAWVPNSVEFLVLKRLPTDASGRWMHTGTAPNLQKQQSDKAFGLQESPQTATDSIGPSYDDAPCINPGVHITEQYPVSGSWETPAAIRPLFPNFPITQVSEEAKVMIPADPTKAMSLLGATAAATLPSSTGGQIESSRPKRRNVRISKDPQSVAARHRRERISDRIRMLQRLVPGGTKMDTASMLDEAIQYVKFLKLQLQAVEQLGSCNSFDSNLTMESRMPAHAIHQLMLASPPQPGAIPKPFGIK